MQHCLKGSCGTVGRAVASKIRGPRVESGQRYVYRDLELSVKCIETMNVKEKRLGMVGVFLKEMSIRDLV